LAVLDRKYFLDPPVLVREVIPVVPERIQHDAWLEMVEADYQSVVVDPLRQLWAKLLGDLRRLIFGGAIGDPNGGIAYDQAIARVFAYGAAAARASTADEQKRAHAPLGSADALAPPAAVLAGLVGPVVTEHAPVAEPAAGQILEPIVVGHGWKDSHESNLS